VRALIDCGACPELHKHEDLEGVVLIRKRADPSKGMYEHDYYFDGAIMTILKRHGGIEILPASGFTERDYLALASGFAHLAGDEAKKLHPKKKR